MNFKKVVVLASTFALLTAPAMAGTWMKIHGANAGQTFEKPFNWHPGDPSEWVQVDNPSQPPSGAVINNQVHVIGGGIQMDGDIGPGLTGGIAAGGGMTGGQVAGAVTDGSVNGNVNVNGGGFAGVGTYNPDASSMGLGGVDEFESNGTWTYADGNTGAHVDVGVDPTSHGAGAVVGSAAGIAGEGSASGSLIGIDNNTEGVTMAGAAQGATGEFEGFAGAVSGSDFNFWCWNVDSHGEAAFSAGIDMVGQTDTNSYSYHDEHLNSAGTRNVTEEGLGSNYMADTTVTSFGYDYDNDHGAAGADACVHGDWAAAGGAGSLTAQNYEGNGGVGNAQATSLGAYTGNGQLNENYAGHASGYTYTNTVTVSGMSGTHNQAGAGSYASSVKFDNTPQ